MGRQNELMARQAVLSLFAPSARGPVVEKVLWDQVVMCCFVSGGNRLLRKNFNIGNFLSQGGIV